MPGPYSHVHTYRCGLLFSLLSICMTCILVTVLVMPVCVCHSYTPAELRQLPVNTVLNGACDEAVKDEVSEQKDETAAADVEKDVHDDDVTAAVTDDEHKNIEVSVYVLWFCNVSCVCLQKSSTVSCSSSP